MKVIISNRNTTDSVKGTFYVTYKALNRSTGKFYQTVHLNPCGSSNKDKDAVITADQLNDEWQKCYKGKCPFNGDEGFEVVRIQQRTQF